MTNIEKLANDEWVLQEFYHDKTPKVNAAIAPKTKPKKDSKDIKASTETKEAAAFFRTLKLAPTAEFMDSQECKTWCEKKKVCQICAKSECLTNFEKKLTGKAEEDRKFKCNSRRILNGNEVIIMMKKWKDARGEKPKVHI